MPTDLLPPGLPAYMRPKDFAAHLNVSLRTIQRYLDQGMPVVGGKKGHAKSIPVAAALAWLRGAPPVKKRGRPPNASRPAATHPVPALPALAKAPSAPPVLTAPALAPAVASQAHYDPDDAIARWGRLLRLDADARFARDIASVSDQQPRTAILAQKLRGCRIYKTLYQLAAECGAACDSSAIEARLIAKKLPPSELSAVRRKIAGNFIQEVLSPDGTRGDAPSRPFVERFLRAKGATVTSENLQGAYRLFAKAQANNAVYMGDLYTTAVSNPKSARAPVGAKLPVERRFDDVEWSKPAYDLADRIDEGRFDVDIKDGAIYVHFGA